MRLLERAGPLDESTHTRAFRAAGQAGVVRVIDALLQQGLPQGLEGTLAIFEVVESGRPALVELLLDAGLPASEEGLLGRPLISAAAAGGDVVTVQLLLDRGADVNASSRGEYSGGPPLVEARTLEMIDFLLSRGADVDQSEQYHNQSILWRVVCGDWPGGAAERRAAVRHLLAAGADPNPRDAGALTGSPDDGVTPLICAVRAGDAALVRLLLEGGADFTVTKRGKTLQEMASASGHSDLVPLLDPRRTAPPD